MGAPNHHRALSIKPVDMYIHTYILKYMNTTTIQKWGNSYAVRLPKASVQKLKLRAGHVVSVTEGEGQTLSIALVPQDGLDLASLVSRITPENRHELTSWGQSIGKEAW